MPWRARRYAYEFTRQSPHPNSAHPRESGDPGSFRFDGSEVRRRVKCKAAADALHIAVATVHGMNCLLTWNCAHIANATMRPRIEAICRNNGFEPPVICTPLELMEE
jgi:hypothetical protein